MLRSEAVARIADGLGFRTDLNAKIALRLQESQRNFENGKTLPWFLLEEDATLSLLDGDNEVAIEADFIREAEALYGPMRYTDTSVTPNKPKQIPKRDFNKALDAYGNTSDGPPKVYSLRATSYYFFPAADQDYTITHSYYKKGAELLTDIENVWLEYAPELLIGDAGTRMALDLRDDAAVALFRAMRDSSWAAIFNETIMREEAARRQKVGGGL